MKIAAITAYPPSYRPHSSFAYAAIQRFLECPDITSIVVLADILDRPISSTVTKRLMVDRCWNYSSPLVLSQLLRALRRHRPDVVWISLHYTHFGATPFSMGTSLMLPACLQLLGVPTVLVLHNFLGSVDMASMGIGINRRLLSLPDAVVMKSLMSADAVFTMLDTHYQKLSRSFPQANVIQVDQDLYRPKSSSLPPPESQTALSFGYYGTHKRLETLLDAFCATKAKLPKARLVIAGANHCLVPNYMEKLQAENRRKLEGVNFVGYVPEEKLDELFEQTNVVVLTTLTDVGSSAALRNAAMRGRGAIVPRSGDFLRLEPGKWGVLYYTAFDSDELADRMVEALGDSALQRQLGERNLARIAATKDTFVQQHLAVFRRLIE